MNWTKLEIFVSKCPVSLFHLHLKIYNKNSLWRKNIWPSSSAYSILHFFQENVTNWKHSIAIFWRYWKVIRKMFVKKQEKPTHPPLVIHQMFECFVITLLKWMKYKNRLTFAYYSITFWDFKSLQVFKVNLEIPYWKSSFPVYRQMLRPPDILCGLLVFLLDKCILTACYLVRGMKGKSTIYFTFVDISSRYQFLTT